jgi:mRNA interferase MazF
VWVNLDPVMGSEANKRRPAVVVSNNGANAAAIRHGRGVVTVIPLTSNVARVYRFQVLLPAVAAGLAHDSKAQAEQIRSVDVRRVGPVLGHVPPALIPNLDAAISVHLALR